MILAKSSKYYLCTVFLSIAVDLSNVDLNVKNGVKRCYLLGCLVGVCVCCCVRCSWYEYVCLLGRFVLS